MEQNTLNRRQIRKTFLNFSNKSHTHTESPPIPTPSSHIIQFKQIYPIYK